MVSRQPSRNGKDSVVRTVHSLLRSDFAGTGLQHRSNRAIAIHVATEYSSCQLRCLHLADVLARTAGGFLSAPQRPTALLAGSFGNCVSDLSQPVSDPLEETTTVHFYRLVLVCRDARTGDRLDTSRRASARGSIHIPASDRFVCADYLGHHGSRRTPDDAKFHLAACRRWPAIGHSWIAWSPKHLRWVWLQAILRCHCWSDHCCVELARVCADVVLEKQRDALEPHASCYD